MKKGIHPKYYPEAKVICSCGNTFVTGSTLPEIKTELCSACHPFYTGKQKLIDTAHRVEKFEAKLKAKEKIAKTRRGKKAKRAKRQEAKKQAQAKAEKGKTAKTADK